MTFDLDIWPFTKKMCFTKNVCLFIYILPTNLHYNWTFQAEVMAENGIQFSQSLVTCDLEIWLSSLFNCFVNICLFVLFLSFLASCITIGFSELKTWLENWILSQHFVNFDLSTLLFYENICLFMLILPTKLNYHWTFLAKIMAENFNF